MIESAHPFDPVALKRLYTRVYGIFEILPIGKEAESGEKGGCKDTSVFFFLFVFFYYLFFVSSLISLFSIFFVRLIRWSFDEDWCMKWLSKCVIGTFDENEMG